MNFRLKGMRELGIGLSSLALFQMSFGSALAQSAPSAADHRTQSPIKHVIVIIGENHSFDNVFATYEPKNGHGIWNLRSLGIVNKDGSPGPNFKLAQQKAATDTTADSFLLSPAKAAFPGGVLPAPLTGGPKSSYITGNSLQLAQESENGLPADYYQYLVSGGTGQASHVPDQRIPNVNALPPGPFQLTNATTLNYHDYSASPVHRFYQMWQQLDCNINQATPLRPSGCDSSLFSWVETVVGAGSNGDAQPANFSAEYSPTAKTTGEGSTALGFYNMHTGDVPYFKHLADHYAMSDNFHQSVNGGTGANHIMIGHGDAIWFSDGAGNPMPPPHNVTVAAGSKNAGIVDEVENPNPAAGTNNWYAEDGYGGGSYGSPSYGGGSYTNCSDTRQPGVAPIVDYLKSLPKPIASKCEPGHYYLLNNYNPGYFGNGNNAFTDNSPNNTVFTIPPSTVPSIGDSLNKADVSWKYYGDQWNNYVGDPYQLNYGAQGANTDEYCNICNPFQYDTSIMTNPAMVAAHIQDTTNLYADISAGTLPAVSFVKPSGLVDGHPSSSKLDLFEGFSKKIIDAVKANPKLWADTAIFVTFDEGGGYYDSGYVQPVDFFGDGTRIPFIVVSPLAKQGHVSHEYTDHVSILKFIERNWRLKPVSNRSRDNFPNPIAHERNPYVPVNSPAIGDLFDMFDFDSAPNQWRW
ncbi:alkaline phosphatase family protein [Solimicrobium silvestre]|uniref:Phosphoesterase family n=1 Tax=Solimicrobium silvestre TaxID=2099400 RepID=A0A2S9H3Q2_9BURK|nr:alkaline phosphatase family protein [Solimicrobium silvestre]PRC94496.1 Phosphoesterase family [Solimicrobium silvestre]